MSLGALFGKKPRPPEVVKQTPIEKVQQSNISRESIIKEYAKRRKATMMSQLSEANVSQRMLGAA